MIKLSLLGQALMPSYALVARCRLAEDNTKLIKRVFENMDTSRKENNKFSKSAAKKRYEKKVDIQRKIRFQAFLLSFLKTC
jgi:ABC-type phosphate/phosphonate transport system substrate-binding protein